MSYSSVTAIKSPSNRKCNLYFFNNILISFITNSRQTAEFERQSEKWAEVKRNLEDQFHAVQNELRNQEMAVSAKQKGAKIIHKKAK